MSLSEISIRRPVFAWMLMAALILFGGISFQRMGISQMPDINFPVVNIALQLDNAAPEVMEMDVVDPIEDAVMGIEGLKHVSSTTSQGLANITCEFAISHNIDIALQDVSNRIAQVKNRLPTRLYPPVITKTNPEDQPILWVMLTADENIPLSRLMSYSRDSIKDQFSSLDGVGNIILGGYVDPNLRVWLDPKKLRKYSLTSSDVISSIQSEHKEEPAGRIESKEKEFNVRVLGEAQNPEEFGNIMLSSRGGAPNYRPIPLRKVARIEEGLSDLRSLSRFNGKTAVGLGIVKQHGSNAVQVSQLIYERVEKLRTTLLPGYHIDVRLDSTKYIRESVHELNFALVLAAILTSIVCFLFLGSWSSTFNVLLAIPTSIVGAFIFLYFFGFTLNTFTLLGLSLSIGIVVDDAIMMLENIVRHFEMGKNRREAALDGSKEITFAALAATLAIAAIFVPVIFMQGVVGRFFYQYGITVTVAVGLSLLEALTLTPMRCARFMESAKTGSGFIQRHMDHFLDWLSTQYRHTLAWSLRHRILLISSSLLLFGGSLGMLSHLRQELIPSQDQSAFSLNIKNPVGYSIMASDQIFKKAETYLREQPEVQDIYTTIGNYQNSDITNAGVIYVILKQPKERKATQTQMMFKVRKGLQELLPQSQVFTQDPSLTGFSSTRGYPIEFTLEGPEWSKLLEYSKVFMKRMQDTGFVEDINTDYQSGMPEIHVVPDRLRAAANGVSVNSMGAEVAALIGGQILGADTEYPKDGRRYSIRVRSEASSHNKASNLSEVYLRNNRGDSGELQPLKSSANIKNSSALQLVSRLDRQRAIPIYANVRRVSSQQEALNAVESIAKETLPPGYRVLISGSAEAFREAFQGLIFALLLGIIVAYMVLASQFNSFIHPITVLVALPFSLTGALLALAFAGQSLNLFSMIGLILLMGIVKKNSILLVDFTNQRRLEGLKPIDALLEACPIRLRPILMTSIATIVGAVPGALALGPGAETRIPMSVAIIGGVGLSTLLTLYIVPCVYSLFVPLERPDTDEAEI